MQRLFGFSAEVLTVIGVANRVPEFVALLMGNDHS